jgi:hypothetical protein
MTTEMIIQFCRRPLRFPTTSIAIPYSGKPLQFLTTSVAVRRNVRIHDLEVAFQAIHLPTFPSNRRRNARWPGWPAVPHG